MKHKERKLKGSQSDGVKRMAHKATKSIMKVVHKISGRKK